MLCASLLAGLLQLFSPSIGATDDVSQAQLESVRNQLKQQTQDIKSAMAQLNKLQDQLKTDELAIAKITKAIRKTSNQIAELTQQQKQLEKQQRQLKQEQQQQQQKLVKQIQAAYQLGRGNYLKMLLSSEQALPSERMMSYYAYLNQARLDTIRDLEQTTQKLSDNQRQIDNKIAEQTRLKGEQTAQRNQLKSQRNKRSKTVEKNNQLLKDERLNLEQLTIAEKYLTQQLEQQAAARKQQKSTTIKNVKLAGLRKNSLRWPVKGRITHRYGSPNTGQSRWQGVVFGANMESPVYAVANGQVVFADWMRGYGLVIALDHGKDYLTLYGYNQALQYDVGDMVAKGDLIATVGDSGGQTSPSLYFQVRYKGKAQNPSHWIKK